MQDLDKFKNEMNLSGKNVYVGHRYVPKIFGEWDNNKLYEPLSIVQYQGTSYTSRQYVPVGVEITNEDFWVVTGNYNAQVEQYRQQTNDVKQSLTLIEDDVDTLNLKNIKVVTPEMFGAVGDGVTDDSEAFQNAINYLKNINGGTIVLSGGEYDVNAITLSSVHNIKFEGNGSELKYNGSSVDTGYYKDGKLFYISQSENLVFENIKLTGRLFYGMDKNNLPTKTDENSIYNKNDKHYGFYILDSNEIELRNVEIREFMTSFYSAGSQHINFLSGKVSDTFFGVQLYNMKNSKVSGVSVYDARYQMYPNNSNTNTIGSGGTAVLIDKCENLKVENIYFEHAATDGIRVQNNSKHIVVENCTSYQARRHAFSVYTSGNEVIFKNCKTINTQDKDYWTGTDTVDTFKRPSSVGSGSCFTIAQGEVNNINSVIYESCIADEKTYSTLETPNDNYFNNLYLTTMLAINPNNTATISNCNFKGYTAKESVISFGDDVVFTNNKVEGNQNITGLTSANPLIQIRGNNMTVKNNILKYGFNGVAVTNGISFAQIVGNKISRTASRGIYILGGNNHYLDDNYIFQVGTGTLDVPAIQFTNTQNTRCGSNVIVEERGESRRISYGIHVDSTNYRFDPGKIIFIGAPKVSELNVDAPFETFKNNQLNKLDFQGLSEAENVTDLKNEFNNLIIKMLNSNLMQVVNDE